MSSALISVSVRQAAALTSLGETAIREAINKQELPARKVGTRVVILSADLEKWIAGAPRVGESS